MLYVEQLLALESSVLPPVTWRVLAGERHAEGP